MRQGDDEEAYEVFVQLGNKSEIKWAGSVRAAEPILAWHAAKEIYTRRENCTVLWVAKRSSMVFSTTADADMLKSADRFDYRTPGFVGRHRRDRERAARKELAEQQDRDEAETRS